MLEPEASDFIKPERDRVFIMECSIKNVIKVVSFMLLIVIGLNSCKKQETITWKVSYVSDIVAQDNLHDWEHYHQTSAYYHGIPEGADSTFVVNMFTDDYGDVPVVFAAYAYCLDKDWGREHSPAFNEEGYDRCQYKLECRKDKVNPYEVQYQLGILDSNYHFVNQ